jgi:hypothetical protein
MAAPKIDPTHKVPFTPLATDVFLRETFNVVRPTNEPIPEFGTPHDDISKAESWPHHKFCWQTAVDEKGNYERWFVADPEYQHLYNWQQSQNPNWPTVTQSFVIPREDYDPTFTAFAAPPNDIIPQAGYVVTGIEQSRIGDKQLDSLYVTVTVTREKTDTPKVSYILDQQTNEIRPVYEEKVPAGTTGTPVDATGEYSEVKAINTLWAIKTTQFAAGLAGKTAPKSQTWEDVINYSWPDVLLGLYAFSFPRASGNAPDSIAWHPIWKRQRYDGPCKAEITEEWSLIAPGQPGGPTPPALTPMLTRDITYRTPLTAVGIPACLHDDILIYDTPGTTHPTLGFYYYEEFFPKTPLLDWPATYVASYTVRPAFGGFLSRKVVVYRPDDTSLNTNLLVLGSPSPGSAINSFDIAWDVQNVSPPGASIAYWLDVNLKADFTGTYLTGFKNKSVGAATNYTVTGLTPQTSYFVRVRALVDGITTVVSNTQMFVATPVLSYTVGDPAVQPDGGTFDFLTATVGFQVSKTFTIANTGNVALSSLAVSVDGGDAADWSLGALGATSLAVGSSTTFDADFTPPSVGLKTTTLTVSSSNGPNQTFTLEGTGVLNITVYDITGGVYLSSGDTMGTITPDNTPFDLDLAQPSASTLAVTAINITGPDALVFQATPTITSIPALSVPVTLQMSVLAGTPIGSYTATLEIEHAGTNTPFLVNLNGYVP